MAVLQEFYFGNISHRGIFFSPLNLNFKTQEFLETPVTVSISPISKQCGCLSQWELTIWWCFISGGLLLRSGLRQRKCLTTATNKKADFLSYIQVISVSFIFACVYGCLNWPFSSHFYLVITQVLMLPAKWQSSEKYLPSGIQEQH